MKKTSFLIAVSSLVMSSNIMSMQIVPHSAKKNLARSLFIRQCSTNNTFHNTDNKKFQKKANQIIGLNVMANAGNLAITGITGNPLFLLPMIPQSINIGATLLAKKSFPEPAYDPNLLKNQTMDIENCLTHSEKRFRQLNNVNKIGMASVLLSVPLHAGAAIEAISVSPETAAHAFQIAGCTGFFSLWISLHFVEDILGGCLAIDLLAFGGILTDPIMFFTEVAYYATNAAITGVAVTPSMLSFITGLVSARFLNKLPTKNSQKAWGYIIKSLKNKQRAQE